MAILDALAIIWSMFHAFLQQQNMFNYNNVILHNFIYTQFRSNRKLIDAFSAPINNRKIMPFISLSNSSRGIYMYEPTLVLNTAALCVKKVYFLAKT